MNEKEPAGGVRIDPPMERSVRILPLKEPSPMILDKLGRYLSAFGNHEAKALTLLIFSNTTEILDKYELNHRVVTSTGGVWRQHYVATESYCSGSLQEIGAVTTEVIDKNNNLYGYVLTPDGQKDGQPMAAYLLLKAYQYAYSLYDLFGATVSFTEHRSPQHSFAILNALAMAGAAITREELISRVCMNPSTVSANLNRLSKNGLIDYQAHSPEVVGKARYQLNQKQRGTEPKTVGTAASLTRGVWEVAISKPDIALSMYDVTNIIRGDPELSARFGHLRSLEKMVSNMLGGLREQGLVTTPFKGLRARSRVEFSGNNSNTKLFVKEVFPKLIAFIEQDPLTVKEFNDAKQFVSSDTQKARELRRAAMERAMLKSPHSPMNRRSREDHNLEVYNYLVANPDARPCKMSGALGLTTASTQRALNDLVRSNKISKRRQGRSVRYNLEV